MFLIQTSYTIVTLGSLGRIGKLVQESTYQVPKRMASKRVSTKQEHVQAKHDCAHPDAKLVIGSLSIFLKPKSAPRVPAQEAKKQQCEIQEVAMDVLNDEGERVFAAIAFSRFTDSTGWRVGPESFVVSPAVVITRHAEASREGKNQ